jgi:hypothetical protein
MKGWQAPKAPPPDWWNDSMKKWTKTLATAVDGIRIEADEEREHFKLFHGKALIAEWDDRQVHGLGDWLTLQLIHPLQTLAGAVRARSAAGARGGKKSVAGRRASRGMLKVDRIEQMLADGKSIAEIAQRTKASQASIRKVRARMERS